MAIDRYSNNDIVLDYEHYMVHDANMYQCSLFSTVTAASVLDFYCCTGTKEAHIKFDYSSDGKSKVQLYEGVTCNANTIGTIHPVYNMYRESTDSCTAYLGYGTAFSTNTEVLLSTILVPGSTAPPTRIGSNARTNTEWVLKPSTRYMVRVTNQDVGTITCAINCNFYEHD